MIHTDGQKVIVQGPLTNPRNAKKEKTITTDSNAILLVIGTPVICHGLKNANHLNGKIGDVRDFNVKADRYEVYFEDSKLKPSLVKAEHFRIVFDLPAKA